MDKHINMNISYQSHRYWSKEKLFPQRKIWSAKYCVYQEKAHSFTYLHKN